MNLAANDENATKMPKCDYCFLGFVFGIHFFPMQESPDTLGVCLSDVKRTAVNWLWQGQISSTIGVGRQKFGRRHLGYWTLGLLWDLGIWSLGFLPRQHRVMRPPHPHGVSLKESAIMSQAASYRTRATGGSSARANGQ